MVKGILPKLNYFVTILVEKSYKFTNHYLRVWLISKTIFIINLTIKCMNYLLYFSDSDEYSKNLVEKRMFYTIIFGLLLCPCTIGSVYYATNINLLELPEIDNSIEFCFLFCIR